MYMTQMTSKVYSTRVFLECAAPLVRLLRILNNRKLIYFDNEPSNCYERPLSLSLSLPFPTPSAKTKYP